MSLAIYFKIIFDFTSLHRRHMLVSGVNTKQNVVGVAYYKAITRYKLKLLRSDYCTVDGAGIVRTKSQNTGAQKLSYAS